MQSAIKFGAGSCRISLDIPESDLLNAAALIPLRGTVLMVTVQVDGARGVESAPRAKPKREESKGEYGAFWKRLIGHYTFENRPDVWELLRVDGPGEVRGEMHRIFKVSSRAQISPEALERFAAEQGAEAIVTLSRRAWADVQEQYGDANE